MMNDWDATRNMDAARKIKEDSYAYRAGYEAAGLECHDMFKQIVHGPLRQKWIGQMIDALLALCEVEDWANPRDRGRVDGFMDIKDGVYASPDPS
jgi:hypothetical protein